MKTKDYVFSARLVVLMIANTMLDYNAICEYSDVEPFKLEQFGVGNLIGVIVAFGVALALSIAAQKAATCKVEGRNRRSIILLVGCGLACAIVAAFRLSYDASSAGRSISGGMLSSLSLADVLFAAMLLLMLVGEVVASYFDRLREHEKEAIMLAAAIERIEADLENIDRQAASAAEVVNARIRETFCAVNSANEMVYESVLRRSGELQNSFVGYASEGDKARRKHAEQLKERIGKMLIPVNEGKGEGTEDSPQQAQGPAEVRRRRSATEEIAANVAA